MLDLECTEAKSSLLSSSVKLRLGRRGDSVGRRRALETQDLVAAAARVFERRGYADATLDDIAAEAGVSKPTVYQYVSSKQRLLETIVEQAIYPLREGIEQIVGSTAGAGDKLEAYVRADLDRPLVPPHRPAQARPDSRPGHEGPARPAASAARGHSTQLIRTKPARARNRPPGTVNRLSDRWRAFSATDPIDSRSSRCIRPLRFHASYASALPGRHRRPSATARFRR